MCGSSHTIKNFPPSFRFLNIDFCLKKKQKKTVIYAAMLIAKIELRQRKGTCHKVVPSLIILFLWG
jgi:hypothetical protein